MVKTLLGIIFYEQLVMMVLLKQSNRLKSKRLSLAEMAKKPVLYVSV